MKNVETISEELLEQRLQELEEKFPERKELDLDAPWQMDLLKLQRKVKWDSCYCLLLLLLTRFFFNVGPVKNSNTVKPVLSGHRRDFR